MRTLSILLFVTLLTPATAWAGGKIQGRVAFTGQKPTAGSTVPGVDKMACGTDPIPDREYAVTDNNLLPNAVITLAPKKGTMESRLETEIQMEQKGCEFLPFIVVAPPGASVEFTNRDRALHNVHLRVKDSGGRSLKNLAQPPGAESLKISMDGKQRGPVHVSCDLHYWMKAWVYVTEDPIAVVADKYGTFLIEDLPEGRYVLNAWHPLTGEAEQQVVKINDGKTTRVSVELPR